MRKLRRKIEIENIASKMNYKKTGKLSLKT